MKVLKKHIVFTSMLLQLFTFTFAYADVDTEIKNLKEQIKTLQETAVHSTEKGGFRIGDTTFNIGGYVKADVLHTNNGVNGTSALLTVRSAQNADDNADSRLDLSARQSRFFIKTSTPVGDHALKTHVEIDFYGGAPANEFVTSSFGPRLRQAYGSWGKLLMGQAWSTFMDLNNLAEINAFGQHASTIFVRQAQIRYTQPFSKGSFMFALENPEDADDDQERPDIVARVNVKGKLGKASAAIVNRTIFDGGNSDSGLAYSLTARIPTFGKDDIRVQYNSGALGRYMGLRTYPDEDSVAAGVQAFESTGFSFAYRHFWTPKLRSTIMYSETEADDTPAADAIESSQSIHVNLMWSANPKLRYGIEYASWEVQSLGRASANELDAIQFSALYSF